MEGLRSPGGDVSEGPSPWATQSPTGRSSLGHSSWALLAPGSPSSFTCYVGDQPSHPPCPEPFVPPWKGRQEGAPPCSGRFCLPPARPHREAVILVPREHQAQLGHHLHIATAALYEDPSLAEGQLNPGGGAEG